MSFEVETFYADRRFIHVHFCETAPFESRDRPEKIQVIITSISDMMSLILLGFT